MRKILDVTETDRLTEADREALRARIRQEKEENARRLAERRQAAAERAKEIFRALSPAGEENPYLWSAPCQVDR